MNQDDLFQMKIIVNIKKYASMFLYCLTVTQKILAFLKIWSNISWSFRPSRTHKMAPLHTGPPFSK